MRSTALALSCMLFASVAGAQEPPTPAPPVVVIELAPVAVPVEQKHSWEWAPHLSAYYGRTTHGHFESPYWYRIQDRRFNLDASTFGGDLSAGRWSVFGSITHVSNRPDVRGSTGGLNLTLATIGPIRPGVGFRYQSGTDSHVLFTSGGTSIAAASDRRLIAAVIDVGIGKYDRSYIRLQGLYGNARRTQSLDLLVDNHVVDSPLATHNFSHSDFLGVGATAAVRLYGLSLEGTATCYRPNQVSVALPGDECVLTGGGSVLLPLWLKFGSGAGAFIRYTRVSTTRPPDNQSLQFLNESTTFGLTLRLP